MITSLGKSDDVKEGKVKWKSITMYLIYFAAYTDQVNFMQKVSSFQICIVQSPDQATVGECAVNIVCHSFRSNLA